MDRLEASFVLMAYNQEKFVRESVLAAFAQEGPPIEIVLSDDCSQDRTFAIMQELTSTYRGPHLVKLNRNPENLGIVAHYARAVSLTTGRWIIQADGDDISMPNRVVRLMQTAREHPDAAAIVSWFHTLYEDGRTEPASIVEHNRLKSMQHASLLELLAAPRRGRGSFTLLGAAAAWRRDLFDKFPQLPEDKDLFEDGILRWRALIVGRPYIISDVLVGYRRHNASITNWGGIVSNVEACERRMRLLLRARKGLEFSRSDLAFAAKCGLIKPEMREAATHEIDRHVGYLDAQLNWDAFSFLTKIWLCLKYWRFGILRPGSSAYDSIMLRLAHLRRR